MNALLTCAGRRTYLVQSFKEALRGRGIVCACDCTGDAPALRDADRAFVVPRIDAPDYFGTLRSLCRQHAVRLLIAVNDLELVGLAQEAPRLRAAGTVAVVAAPEVIATCQDKWATFQLLRSLGVPTPATYLSVADARQALARGAIDFPLLIKPRWGTTSIGVERVDNERELALAWEWGQVQIRRTILAQLCPAGAAETFVIQPWLPGQEYGMDVVNDLNGRYVATLARRKLAMRAGNTDRAVSVDDPVLEHLGQVIGNRLGHPGSLDCDVIATERGYSVLDLNPRLGGGYPFSHCAGANLPAALLAWARGEPHDPSWLRTRPGVVVAKYDGMAVMDHVVASVTRGGDGQAQPRPATGDVRIVECIA